MSEKANGAAPDHKALLAGFRPAQRSVQLCMRRDLASQMQVLQRQLIEAEAFEKVSGSLDGGRAVELARQVEALHEEMAAQSIEVVIRAVPRRQWTALLAEHPPREGNERDARMGIDEDGFFDAALRACVVAPAFDDEDWERLDEVLTVGQWEILTNAVWAANARDVDVPFSPRALRILSTSDDE